MISPKYFIEALKNNNFDFFTGIPDSLLKSLCAYIQDNLPSENHIIAANEGGAVGLAAGYYLATGKIPVVYMQNSGIGNAINPLLSLIDKEVFNIPMLLLVGWRGKPGIKDEPQHVKQGKVTIPLFNTMGIKNTVLSVNTNDFIVQLKEALAYIKKTNEPFAFIIEKDTFEDYKLQRNETNNFTMPREAAIKTLIDSMDKTAIVVSTTGMISRELFEYRECQHHGHERDFLTVGSMGHASQIALGVALNKKEKRIYCFDGDGAVLMHTGSLAITGSAKPDNFIHVVFNNGAHDSVGGQPTVGLQINIPQIALSCGYLYAVSVETEDRLNTVLAEIKEMKGPILIEIKVKKGARKDLKRPTDTPVQNKLQLMNFLSRQ